jgi:hypothetical protein
MLSRTPTSAATKRCLDKAFEDEENSSTSERIEQNLSKKFNLTQEEQLNLSEKYSKFGKLQIFSIFNLVYLN